ncbi:MAG: hypothetical protein KJ787_04860 [Gammaproteobacteria bacterium]|nr:hypothetical protein [Gammaproteobacteria bacterium]MBU1645644.1 hypothetical protein [Gammaproteobacteria bacterium]MBU1973554.1 hypothetical protein [Gammaproteobacteria bacterium]
MSKLMRDLRQAEETRLATQYAQDQAAANAEAETEARGRIGSNTARLVEMKAQELAEAEARALAEIRARSERTLAAQAEALCDAERKLELTAIDRRSVDLEAAREAAAREAADIAAREAAEKRLAAEHAAEQAANEKAEAAARATAAAEARRQAAIEEKSAVAARRRAEWAAFWAGARFKPVALAGALMGVLGLGSGLGLSGRLPSWPAALGEPQELRLRLDADVAAVGAGAARHQSPHEIPHSPRQR